MPERIELITKAPKQKEENRRKSPCANHPKYKCWDSNIPETIPFKEVRTYKQKVQSTALVIYDVLNLIPYREITHSVVASVAWVVKYSAIGVGKVAGFIVMDVIPFVIMDVIPFVLINSFNLIVFIVKLLVFFVTDIAGEFKSTKTVSFDKDRMPSFGQNQNITINDNHGTINIFNR